MIDVNLRGTLYGIAAALPHMKTQQSGHIINVSSVAGHKVRPGSAVYAATKTGVRVISEGLRQEVKPYNIRTTVISPGALATELADSVTEPDIAEYLVQNNGGFLTALPFVGATVLVAALPLLLFLLFYRRAQRFMPKVRDWMNANSWLVNIIVCVVFIVLIAF